MNRDSRSERGKGKRRKVSGKAEQVPKLKPPPEAAEPVLPPKPDRAQLREMIIDELAAYALDAVQTIGTSQRRQRGRAGVRPPRGSGADSANAKWLLELLLERLQEAAPQPGTGAEGDGAATPVAAQVDELAERRTALRNLLRQQRNAMNK